MGAATPNTNTEIARDTVDVWLYQPADLRKIDELRQAVNAATRVKGVAPEPTPGAKRRLSDPAPETAAVPEADAPPPGKAEAEAHDKFVAAAKKRAVHVVLQEIPGKEFRDLKAAHPPREGNAGDMKMGANDEAMPVPLLLASIIAPAFTSDAAKQEWIENLRDAHYDTLYSRAWLLNVADDGPDPKDSLASELTQASAAQQR